MYTGCNTFWSKISTQNMTTTMSEHIAGFSLCINCHVLYRFLQKIWSVIDSICIINSDFFISIYYIFYCKLYYLCYLCTFNYVTLLKVHSHKVTVALCNYMFNCNFKVLRVQKNHVSPSLHKDSATQSHITRKHLNLFKSM